MTFANRLKSENKNVYLEIQGHTDSTGSDMYNYKLGEERAEAVRRYLNKQGVALNRMSTISYGKDEPVDFEQDQGRPLEEPPRRGHRPRLAFPAFLEFRDAPRLRRGAFLFGRAAIAAAATARVEVLRRLRSDPHRLGRRADARSPGAARGASAAAPGSAGARKFRGR